MEENVFKKEDNGVIIKSKSSGNYFYWQYLGYGVGNDKWTDNIFKADVFKTVSDIKAAFKGCALKMDDPDYELVLVDIVTTLEIKGSKSLIDTFKSIEDKIVKQNTLKSAQNDIGSGI